MSLTSCYYDNEEELYPKPDNKIACGDAPVTFSSDVSPIISSNCLQCHSQAANMGNVILEGYTQIKIYADNGQLYGVVSHSQGFSPMPKNMAKLSDCNIAIIKKWIDSGSPNN